MWPIWDRKKSYQLVPKRDRPNQEVAETYHLSPKSEWLIWQVKKTCPVMPKKGGPIRDVTKTYHQDLGFIKGKSLLAWTIYFHRNRFLFFSKILLSGVTSHNWRSHFARMIFLHMKYSFYGQLLDCLVCNFQSMNSPMELNSLSSKFFCYITGLVTSPD